jgi:molybdate transport system substrate-binding protein
VVYLPKTFSNPAQRSNSASLLRWFRIDSSHGPALPSLAPADPSVAPNLGLGIAGGDLRLYNTQTAMCSNSTKGAMLLMALSLFPQSAICDQITVLYPGAYADILSELVPSFEHATDRKIISVRDGPSNIPNRMRAGQPADVVILPDDTLNELIRDGYISRSSRMPLAKSSIGMVVRAGARKPDISTVDALKRTLLEAKSIACSSQISGLYLVNVLFPRLGIADQIRSRTKRIEMERVGAVVARGEAEIGFQQISELLTVPGVDYVGPIPTEVQKVTLFSAGVATRCKNSDAAAAAIRAWTRVETTIDAASCRPLR